MSKDNKNVVLVMGPPNTGKSASLRNLPQKTMAYLNADNKEIPFKHEFLVNIPIQSADHIIGFIEDIERSEKFTGGVLDTLTMLMSMYERQFVVPLAGGPKGQQAWGDYGNFYRALIHAIKTGSKDYAILAHEDRQLNEQSMLMESKVPVKGAVGKIGVEADFSVILSSMMVPLSKIADKDGIVLPQYKNDLLNITPEEKEDGIKYVLVTRATKEFSGSKIRSPMEFWSRNEQYIDNDLSKVFNRLKAFYVK